MRAMAPVAPWSGRAGAAAAAFRMALFLPRFRGTDVAIVAATVPNAGSAIFDCSGRHMFEVRDLRMVRAIHEHGSLVRAARVLGIAQPALTRQLAALEARLRGPLFERSPRGVTTTDLGRAVLTDASE